MNISNISLSRVFTVCAILAAGAFFTSACSTPTDSNAELAIGAVAPLSDVKMTNVDGSTMSLMDAAGKNDLLVVFSCNTCPFVVGNGTKSDGWEGRYKQPQKLMPMVLGWY